MRIILTTVEIILFHFNSSQAQVHWGSLFSFVGGTYEGQNFGSMQSPLCLSFPAGHRQPGTHFPKQAGLGSSQVSSHGLPQSDHTNGAGHSKV